MRYRKNIFIGVIILLSVVWFGKGYGQQSQQQIRSLMEREEVEQSKEQREEWIEQMHRAAPGVNWRNIDEQTRDSLGKARIARRVKTPVGARVVESIEQGALTGVWGERGSVNQAGRMLTTEFDVTSARIYAASSGGNVWQGSLDGSGWRSLNDLAHIDGVRLVRILRSGGLRRILVIGRIAVSYSDDDGASWKNSSGLTSIRNTGEVRRGIVTDANTIYFLGSEWDYSTGKMMVSIYRSTDLGITFTRIGTVDNKVELCDLWSSREKSSNVFLLTNDRMYTLNADGSFVQLSTLPFQKQYEKIQMAGCRTQNATTLYLAASANGSDIFASTNGGATWTYRSRVDNDPFQIGSFTCSPDNPSGLYLGGLNCWRSHDAGTTWTPVNEWWEYYGQVSTKLHADISGIDIHHDASGKGFVLISTDGGVYLSRDSLITVQNISLSGLNVSQYYSTYSVKSTSGMTFAASQDQGVQRSLQQVNGVFSFEQLEGGDYGHVVSGDGGSSIWYVYPGFAAYRPQPATSPAFIHWDFVTIKNQSWMPPLMAHPSRPDQVYVGGGSSTTGAKLWKLTAQSGAITAVEESFDFSGGDPYANIASMASSSLDPRYRYVVTNTGRFYLSTDGGSSWRFSQGFSGPASQYLYGSKVLPSPAVLGRVYVAGSGYSNPPVYVSDDHGVTFTRFDTGLPSTLVYDLATTPDGKTLFAATEVGPYIYLESVRQWSSLAGVSAPDQIYWCVEYLPTTQTARFGTYGRGIWDFTINSLAPSLPSLGTPADNAAGVPSNPTLSWNPIFDASWYGLQVSTTGAFSTPLVNVSNLTNSTYSLTGLSGNTKYFWRVNAGNSAGTSDWSTAYSFTTVLGAPTPPTLAAPVNGATGVSSSPTLSWGAVTSATSYTVQISIYASFSSLLVNQSGITSTSFIASGLPSGTVYFWHVSASGSGGTSAFSSTFSFTTSSSSALSSFNYTDFTTTANLTLVRDAQKIGNRIRLTTSELYKTGAMWYSAKVNLAGGFRTAFQFQISNLTGPGAEGFAFVLHNTSNPVLSDVSKLGYDGIPSSVAVEFDTYRNVEYGDPNDNHISIQTGYSGPNSVDHSKSLGTTTSILKMADGNIHTVSIEYSNRTMKVSLDNQIVLSALVNLASALSLSDGMGSVGFTGTTGGYSETHDILNWSFESTTTGIASEAGPQPAKFGLDQNFPNPFNPTTTISYRVDIAGVVCLTIYDDRGVEVRRLVDGYQNAGSQQVVWDGRDDNHRLVSSGVYFYTLRRPAAMETKRMILLK